MAACVAIPVMFYLIGVAANSKEGSWEKNIAVSQTRSLLHFSKSLFKGSDIYLSIQCDSGQDIVPVNLQWTVRRSPCANEYIDLQESQASFYLNNPTKPFKDVMPYKQTKYVEDKMSFTCSKDSVSVHINLVSRKWETAIFVSATTIKPTSKPQDEKLETTTAPSKESQAVGPTSGASGKNANTRRKRSGEEGTKTPSATSTPQVTTTEQANHNVLKVPEDGYYLFAMGFSSAENKKLTLKVTVKMKYGSSYLSAEDWPLLIFYGVMGLVYIAYGIFWLVMLACNWRDLLRVQFWIGGVIFLGMLEKAVFFGEYESLNNTGKSVTGAIIFAELVSCLKRTFARMLVIVVSLGHGIVKPRLGQTFHKVVIVGFVFFILASIEACTRALNSKADQSTSLMIASIPVAVTDAIICWWIFSSLLQTTRTLRLRRNVVKLSLYRHFTNALIFSVIASVAYMIWSITQHRLKDCLSDWKELWMDEAFWHLLFSVILFIIMILWRPSANNQRYAFSPLLDAAEDDLDDEQTLSEAYEGMKMRTSSQQRNGSPRGRDDHKGEDDLKWVEDNIPSSLVDRVLPALDSDEEIMNTKFEVSKME